MTDSETFRKKGPLADLKVLEMGVLLAGPFCGQLLGDFGAEVIKIEQPVTGDPMRDFGQVHVDGKSLWWPIIARNKKSITLNLRAEEGQEIVRKLVAEADILVENFRPGTLERWNLGYEELSQINPGLILVRVSGYGQTGPYAPRPGYASVGEAVGGVRYVVGDPTSAPGRVGISYGDSLTATFAALGALMAVHARHSTGKGQVVDAAIYESVLAFMESLIPEYQKAGYIRERTGAVLPKIAPSNVYPTKDDKMIIIAANQDTVFKRLADAMGQPELASDERYATHMARGERQKELDDLIAEWTRTWDAVPLQNHLVEFDVPVGVTYRAPEMLEDEHFAARDAIIRMVDPELGEIAMQNTFPKLSDTPGNVRSTGPALGQHNDEIYGEMLGMSAEKIARMRDDGII